MSTSTNNGYMRIRGNEEIAVYHEDPDFPEWNVHPYISALKPLFQNKDEVMDFLTVIPDYRESIRGRDMFVRIAKLYQINLVFIPSWDNVDTAMRLQMAWREGYLSRNPLDIRHSSHKRHDPRDSIQNNYFQLLGHGGLCCFGFSGVGKTFLIQLILLNQPQVIYHNNFKGQSFNQVQVSWMKLDCPKNGSIPGLYASFLTGLDILIPNSTYVKDYLRLPSRAGGQAAIISYISSIAKNIGLGIFVIDETQLLYMLRHSSRFKSKKIEGTLADELIDFLVQFENEVGSPLILIGTPPAKIALEAKFRHARRASSYGDPKFDLMKRGDDQWERLVSTLLRLIYVQKDCNWTPEHDEALFDESQGIPAVVIAIWKMVQYVAIMEETEEITPTLIKRIIPENFPRLKRALAALREYHAGNEDKIFEFEDLYWISVQEELDTTLPVPPQHQQNASPDRNNAEPNSELTRNTRTSRNTSKGKKKEKELAVPEDGSLITLMKDASDKGVTPYNALKAAGYIFPATEFIIGSNS